MDNNLKKAELIEKSIHKETTVYKLKLQQKRFRAHMSQFKNEKINRTLENNNQMQAEKTKSILAKIADKNGDLFTE